jgi:hypothetical protein
MEPIDYEQLRQYVPHAHGPRREPPRERPTLIARLVGAVKAAIQHFLRYHARSR